VTTKLNPFLKFTRISMWLFVVLALLLAGPMLTMALGRTSASGDWRTASHRTTGLSPDPALHREPIVEVFASRTFGWRGAFADHTWLAAKPEAADRYTRYEVIGWYARGYYYEAKRLGLLEETGLA